MKFEQLRQRQIEKTQQRHHEAINPTQTLKDHSRDKDTDCDDPTTRTTESTATFEQQLNCQVTHQVLKMTKNLCLKPAKSGLDLYEQIRHAFGLPGHTQIVVTHLGRPLSRSKSFSSLQKLADIRNDDSLPLLLELHCTSVLLGGMSNWAQDSDSSNHDLVQTRTGQVSPWSESQQKEAQELIRNIQGITDRNSGSNSEILAELKNLLPPEQDQTKVKNEIVESFKSHVKDFKKASKAHTDSLKYAFELPLEHSYSNTVRLRGTDAAIFARIEIHKAIFKTTCNYRIVSDDAKLEECKENPPEWHQFLTIYRFLRKSEWPPGADRFYPGVHIIERLMIDQVQPNYSDPSKLPALFAGEDQNVFWVSGDEKLKLNIYKQGEIQNNEEKHKTTDIDQESALYSFWKQIDCTGEKISLPSSEPILRKFGDKQVIIFSHMRSGEQPSIYFQSVEEKQEFLQYKGASMLLHLSPISKDSQEYKGLFYTNPLLVKQMHDQQDIEGLRNQISQPRSADQNDGIIPVMKTVTINMQEEMEREEKAEPIDLSEDKQSTQVQCPKLQKHFGSWMSGGAFTVHQSSTKDGKMQFAISNNSLMAICEQKDDISFLCRQIRVIEEGAFQIQTEKESYQVSEFNLKNKNLKCYEIPVKRQEDQDKQEENDEMGDQNTFDKKEKDEEEQGLKEQELPEDIQKVTIRRDSALLANLIQYALNEETTDQRQLISFYSTLRKLSAPNWKIENLYPFYSIVNYTQPERVYIAWIADKVTQLISFDLSKICLCYSQAQEIYQWDRRGNSKLIVIVQKLDQVIQSSLQFEFPGFDWTEMTFKSEFLQVSLQKTRYRKDLISPFVINHAMCYSGTQLFCTTDVGMIQFRHSAWFNDSHGKVEGLRLTCSMIQHSNDIIFIVEDSNSKTCSLRSEQHKWSYHFKTEKILQMQQCPENERNQLFYNDLKTELLMLDSSSKLTKYRIKSFRQGGLETIMVLDLSNFEILHELIGNCVQHQRLENFTLTSRLITHKDTVYSLQTGQGCKLIENLKSDGEEAEFSVRVRRSNQIMIGVKDKSNLKVCITNEPGSRSFNPVGHGYFGLLFAKRAIYIGANNLLVQWYQHNEQRSKQKKQERRSVLSEEERKIGDQAETYDWSIIDGDSVRQIDQKLEDALNEKDWSKITSSQTIDGTCKLLLQNYKIGNHQILGKGSRLTKILTLSHDVKLLDEPKENSFEWSEFLIQEEVLINYAGEQYPVQIVKKLQEQVDANAREMNEEAKDIDTKNAKNESTSDSKNPKDAKLSEIRLQASFVGTKQRRIVSQKRLKSSQIALVGSQVFWYVDDQTTQIRYFDCLNDNSQGILDLTKYEVQSALQHPIYLKACEPHQMIRTSNNSDLCKETMIRQSEHLQVTANNVAHIFDCKHEKLLLINALKNMQDFIDPQSYVENGQSIYNTNQENGLHIQLQSNFSGSTIFERQLKQKHDEEEEEEGRVIGVYRTYSILDILQINEMLKNGAVGDKLDLQILFTLFGKQTLFDLFKDNLRLLDSLRQAVENTPLREGAFDDWLSANEIKLASMLTMNTRVRKIEERKEDVELTSLMRDSLSETGRRDILVKIGQHTKAFSIFKVLKNQEDCGHLFTSFTPILNEELDHCFIETIYTRKKLTLPWPEKFNTKSITFSSREFYVSEEFIEDLVDKETQKLPKDAKKIQRPITVRMIDLRWLFNDKKNFLAFSRLLQNLPSKVYSSRLLKGLLSRYWEETQWYVIKWQFIPHCALALLSIIYFAYMLPKHNEHQATWLQIVLSIILVVFLVNAARKEYKQLVDGKMGYFKEFWNYVDSISILLTAFVIVESFQLTGLIEADSLRAPASIASCLFLSKIFYWFRLFKKRAFYILLVAHTLRDSIAFITLIFIALLMFGVPMYILNQNRLDDDSQIIAADINWWLFDILINQYLLALGEFTSLDAFNKGSQTGLCYTFFFGATFLTQITMFNMLIAIMGDTFDHLMENYEVNEIMTQFRLINDEISVMKTEDSEQNLNTFFYIIQPDGLDEDEQKDDGWYGTITHITRVIEKNNKMLNQRLENDNEKLQAMTKAHSASLKSDLLYTNRQIETKMTKQIQQLETQIKGIQQLMTPIKESQESSQKKQDDIMDSLDLLLNKFGDEKPSQNKSEQKATQQPKRDVYVIDELDKEE